MVGALADFTLSFETPVPLKQEDKIFINFPPDVLPFSRTNFAVGNCFGDGKFLAASLTCSVNG